MKKFCGIGQWLVFDCATRRALTNSTSLMFCILLISGCSLFQPRARQLTLRKSWVRQTWNTPYAGFRMSHQMSPLIHKDMVISGNAIDGLTAYHRLSGHLIWRLNIQNGVSSGAREYKSKLYFGGSDGQYYCVDAMTGRLIWTFPTRVENLSQSLVVNDVVYFLSGNDTLYSLDANTGKQKWVYVRNNTSDLSIRGGSQPVMVQNTLYVGFADGYLVALSSRDGSVSWERQVNTNLRFKDVDATPVIEGNNIYISGFDNALYSLNRLSGQIQWRLEGGSSFPVTIDGKNLYYSTSTSQLRAVNKESGSLVWEKNVKNGIASQPMKFKDFLIYGESEGELKVVQIQNGQHVLSFHPGLGVAATTTPLTPDIDNSRIYFMSRAGNLYSMILQWERQ